MSSHVRERRVVTWVHTLPYTASLWPLWDASMYLVEYIVTVIDVSV